MGADYFEVVQHGTDVASAFAQAHRDAVNEHGRGGYSGSLAEKGDYVVVDRRPRWLHDASKWADGLIVSDESGAGDKWGPANAIPVVIPNEGERPAVRTVDVTFTVKGDAGEGMAVGEGRQARTDATNSSAATKARMKAGERVTRIVIKSAIPTYKVRSVATEGKAVTRYVVDGMSGRDTWENGFASQSEARQQLATWAATPATPQRWSNPLPSSESFTITSVTRRESGEPLVVVTRTLGKTEFTATVTLETVPPVPNRIDGWMFFGCASS